MKLMTIKDFMNLKFKKTRAATGEKEHTLVYRATNTSADIRMVVRFPEDKKGRKIKGGYKVEYLYNGTLYKKPKDIIEKINGAMITSENLDNNIFIKCMGQASDADFLKTEEEIQMYIGALYSARMWAQSLDNKKVKRNANKFI